MSDLDRCPSCGGVADNGFDRCFPPNVYCCKKCEVTLDGEYETKTLLECILGQPRWLFNLLYFFIGLSLILNFIGILFAAYQIFMVTNG